MSYFGKNVKKLRTVKKLSQNAFAELFGLTRASIGSYEEGRAEAKIDTIIEIANYFSLTLDQIIRKELTINEILHFDIFNEPIGAKSGIRVGIPIVPRSIEKEYCKKHTDTNFRQSLELIDLGNSFVGFRRIFVHNDEEMSSFGSGIKEGDWLICKKNSTFLLDQVYVFVLETGILVRIVEHIKADVLIIRSNTIEKKKQKLLQTDIKEAWQLVSVLTHNFVVDNYLQAQLFRIENKIDKLNT